MGNRVQFVQHRVNTLEELSKVHPEYGCEIDLRSDVNAPGKLHLSHDPWKRGLDFETWLQSFRERESKGTLILNTKEDGLEDQILDLLNKYKVSSFFFLDTALPTLVKKTIVLGQAKFAVRFSSFEPIQQVTAFAGKAQWIWADGFSGVYPPVSELQKLAKDFSICLVSPELQGQPLDLIQVLAKDVASYARSVCTKRPDLWEKAIEANIGQ